MSVTLYTPGTGFPDLEIKIAYGLARVGIEAYENRELKIVNNGGFYSIIIDGELETLEKTFTFLCKRLLSSKYIPFSTPGIGGRTAGSITVLENEVFTLREYTTIPSLTQNKKSENVCKHKGVSIGNVIGLSSSTSFHNRRNGLDLQFQYKNPKDKTSPKIPRRPTNPKNLCKHCGMLALLGTWFATFIFNIKDREVIVIPLPKYEIRKNKLHEIFSLQHQIRREWINHDIPQRSIPLIFLSKIPSSVDILGGFDLFIAILSRQQGYHVESISLVSIQPILNFLGACSYNNAIIETMLNKNAFAGLEQLNFVLYQKDTKSLLKFARLYVQETSPKDSSWTNLLYPETTNYLLKEVAMIKPEIIENPAIGSLARTLRYFVRERKYGYVDDIRNARKDSRDFEETIAKMLREAEIRRVQEEEKKRAGKQHKFVNIPKDSEIKEVFKLADGNFEDVKTALVMLAFTFPTKKEEAKEGTNEEVYNA